MPRQHQPPSQTWRTFLANHATQLIAADFFVVPTAMRAKMQGTVVLECVVNASGDVSDVRIVRSLDTKFGLDQQAIKAAKQWKFAPGLRMGQPVAVFITIELSFTLR
jgi:TonB family protein